MERDWEEFMTPPPGVGSLHVTVNAQGEFLLGVAAFDRLGRPDAVVILFDKANRVIGMKPAHPRISNAYPLRTSVNGRHRLVRANRFCRQHQIKFDRRLAFESPKIEDGVLILDPAATYPVGTKIGK